jgi:hypothetical protein
VPAPSGEETGTYEGGKEVLNFNDAEITSVYVSQTSSSTIEDDTPNAPSGGNYDVTIEIVGGTGVQDADYKLTWGCFDWTAGTAAPAALTAGLPPSGKFGVAPWVGAGALYSTLTQLTTISLAAGAGQNHLYQYSVTLTSNNGQVTSHAFSDPFQLF